MSELEEIKHYLGEASDPREALEWAGESRAAMVDLKFCDLLGTWQHVTLPISAFDESAFDEGLGFDGSSIRGWQGISESDMLLLPDASSAPATSSSVIAKLFRCPSRSVNQRRMYSTRSCSTRPSTCRRASGSDVARALLSIIPMASLLS